MQRLQKTFCVGGILGLCLSLSAPAQAQVIYVQSSNFRAAPVTQSFVQTRTIGSPHYSYSYGTNYSYGGNYGSNYSYGQALNNRISGPARWHENVYLPESSYEDAGVSNQSYVVSQPVVSSRAVSSRSFVAAQPRFVTQPVTTYQSVVSSQPVYVSQPVASNRTFVMSQPVASARTFVMSQPVIQSEPVVISQPVRVYRSVSVAPQTIRTEAVCPTTKRLESSDPKVSVTESTDGRRTKTYRYEYELDHRPGRVTIEFDSKD